MRLSPEPSKYPFPTITLNLDHLASYLSKSLPLSQNENEVYFVRDTAAHVVGGPPSSAWHLLVVIEGLTDGQKGKSPYQKKILETLKNYLVDRILEISPNHSLPFGPMLLKGIYKLNRKSTSYGLYYEFGPQCTLYFSSNRYRPMNASSTEGWQISHSGITRCIIENRILTSPELKDALLNVSQRHFFPAKVSGLFIPMLRNIANGATLLDSDRDLMKTQLEKMTPIEMKKLWREFQQQHQGCLRTQMIHFLNLLLLVQESSLYKTVAENWEWIPLKTRDISLLLNLFMIIPI